MNLLLVILRDGFGNNFHLLFGYFNLLVLHYHTYSLPAFETSKKCLLVFVHNLFTTNILVNSNFMFTEVNVETPIKERFISFQVASV